MDVTFFASSEDFRRWLEHNHHKEAAIQLGFYKTSAKRQGMTYQEALDQALCYGWIDGVRKNVDAHSYTILSACGVLVGDQCQER